VLFGIIFEKEVPTTVHYKSIIKFLFYFLNNSATCFAIANEDVNAGDSIPNNWIQLGCSSSLYITKSHGFCNISKTPESETCKSSILKPGKNSKARKAIITYLSKAQK